MAHCIPVCYYTVYIGSLFKFHISVCINSKEHAVTVCLFICLLVPRYHSVTLTGLELAELTRLALDLQRSSCRCHPNAEIKDMSHHHVWPVRMDIVSILQNKTFEVHSSTIVAVDYVL